MASVVGVNPLWTEFFFSSFFGTLMASVVEVNSYWGGMRAQVWLANINAIDFIDDNQGCDICTFFVRMR